MVIRWTDDDPEYPEPPKKIRAAQYVRMSTEHQQYSTDNQSDAIAIYAEKRGFKIVRTYADEGRSGLNIGGRPALRALLDDVENGRADYEALLVCDVSSWGRFQDPNEAASYELRCRRAGVQVHYCDEQFENDGSIGSSIIKTVKRAMAGEYSRELSVKVFAGRDRRRRRGDLRDLDRTNRRCQSAPTLRSRDCRRRASGVRKHAHSALHVGSGCQGEARNAARRSENKPAHPALRQSLAISPSRYIDVQEQCRIGSRSAGTEIATDHALKISISRTGRTG